MNEIDILLGATIVAFAVFTLVALRWFMVEAEAPRWAWRIMIAGVIALGVSGLRTMAEGFGDHTPIIQPLLSLVWAIATFVSLWVVLRHRRRIREH